MEDSFLCELERYVIPRCKGVDDGTRAWKGDSTQVQEYQWQVRESLGIEDRKTSAGYTEIFVDQKAIEDDLTISF